MPESNWDMCLRLAREHDKDRLIRQLLMQIAKMRKPRERSIPLWSFVGQATTHGSGVSCGICTVYGVNSTTGERINAPPTTNCYEEIGGPLMQGPDGDPELKE